MREYFAVAIFAENVAITTVSNRTAIIVGYLEVRERDQKALHEWNGVSTS